MKSIVCDRCDHVTLNELAEVMQAGRFMELEQQYSSMELMADLAVTPDPEPNLITGVGHGHYRPLRRHKAEANHAKKLKKARKATKRSRRRNRKGS